MKNKSAGKKRQAVPAVQQHLPLSEIKNDSVVMKDGTLRAVLLISSINFALKNEDEQSAIISAYVSFLNTLEHPLQIVIQSRELFIKPYLEQLAAREKEQANELLRLQMADYRSFVQQLVEMGEIMSKQFFVVVPYDPLTNKKRSFWSRAGEVFNPAKLIKLKEERFLQRKYDLDQRVRQVEAGLQGMGLQTIRLDTQSLIEMFYATFNPDISFSEHLPRLEQMQLE